VHATFRSHTSLTLRSRGTNHCRAAWPGTETSHHRMPRLPANAVHPFTRAQWRAWLAKNHRRTTGVWLVWYRRETGKPRVEYAHAVEEALCYGWIDSKAMTLDATRSMQWFSPRKSGSRWSALNKERVARMIAQRRMTAAGLAKVAAAQADGSWSRLDGVEALEIPRDLAAAFRRHRRSGVHFEMFPASVKRMILAWILEAKKPETRARRIEETARLASQNIRARGNVAGNRSKARSGRGNP